MRYDLLSFDLDGTLVDTAGEIAEAANLTLLDFDIPRRAVDQITGLIGAGTRELMRRLLAQVLVDEPARDADGLPFDAVMHRFDIHYERTAGATAQPYPGCQQALTQLRSAGVRLVCLTNKELRFAQRVLDATGLAEFFELVVGGDSLPVKKPDRAVVDHVVAVLQGNLQTMAHVGDSRTDVETARHAGIAAWVVPYGYNAGEPIEAALPDRVFTDLPAVAAHVLAVNTGGVKEGGGDGPRRADAIPS